MAAGRAAIALGKLQCIMTKNVRTLLYKVYGICRGFQLTHGSPA